MNLYSDHFTTKGFSLEDFKELARHFKAVKECAFFKSEYVWLNCKEGQEEFIDFLKDYFMTYTSFEKIELLRSEEGFWLKPVFGDYASGGKYRYLDDLITADYVINVENQIVTEEELKQIMPYEYYFAYFKDEEMREPLGFWMVEKDEGYKKVRTAMLENVNKEVSVNFAEVKERIEVLLGKSTVITVDGFPNINKEEIVKELKLHHIFFDRSNK